MRTLGLKTLLDQYASVILQSLCKCIDGINYEMFIGLLSELNEMFLHI